MATKGAAGAVFARDPELSIVPAQYVLDDRKAQANATIFPRPAPIDAEKSLGQAWNMLLRNTFPGIAYDKVGAGRIRAPGQLNYALW